MPTYALFILIKKRNKKLNLIFYSAILFIIINAFATAAFGNVLARLNSRVVWILPFICVCIIIGFIVKGRKALDYKDLNQG